jgi:hypothetical protein
VGNAAGYTIGSFIAGETPTIPGQFTALAYGVLGGVEGEVVGTIVSRTAAAAFARYSRTSGRLARVLSDDELSTVTGGTKTDNLKKHVLNGELDAARRELAGEVVARKPNGVLMITCGS